MIDCIVSMAPGRAPKDLEKNYTSTSNLGFFPNLNDNTFMLWDKVKDIFDLDTNEVMNGMYHLKITPIGVTQAQHICFVCFALYG